MFPQRIAATDMTVIGPRRRIASFDTVSKSYLRLWDLVQEPATEETRTGYNAERRPAPRRKRPTRKASAPLTSRPDRKHNVHRENVGIPEDLH